MLLIGSRALMFRVPQILGRKPKDFDFVCSMNEYDLWMHQNETKINPTKIYSIEDGAKIIAEGETPCEFEIIQPGSSAEMLTNLVENDKTTIKTSFGLVPNLDLLFTLKHSHRYKKDSPHTLKTLIDWSRMKAAGARVRPEYQDFLKLREKETYKNKTPKLKSVSKMEFFNPNSGVNYVYDHDSIHRAVCIGNEPAYKKFQEADKEVECSKNLFFSLPEEIRINSYLEESAVLAIERSLVPFLDALTPDQAWLKAFTKVITSISSGWWREWGWENGIKILSKKKEYDFWDKFQFGLKEGIVKPFNPDAKENPYK